MTKCQKDPICDIFSKRGLFKDIKNDIPLCQTQKYKKYKYANTQIQHMTKCQKDPTGGIFLKEDCPRISKITFPCVIHRYTGADALKVMH